MRQRAHSVAHQGDEFAEQHGQRVGAVLAAMPVTVLAAVDGRDDRRKSDRGRDLGDVDLLEGHAVVVVVTVQAVDDGSRPLVPGCSWHRDRPAHSGFGEAAVEMAADLARGRDPDGRVRPLGALAAGAVGPAAAADNRASTDAGAEEECAAVQLDSFRRAVTRAATMLARIGRPSRSYKATNSLASARR